jgi:hypothetical protein
MVNLFLFQLKIKVKQIYNTIKICYNMGTKGVFYDGYDSNEINNVDFW